MSNKRTKRESEYKQMTFETAVRNPERYIGILSVVKKYEGRILDDENLLQIVSDLYLAKEVSSDKIQVSESTTITDIQESVKEVNSTRNADGGFPKGYPSRFWTYMRTLSELGMVYARYNDPFKISKIGKMLIDREIDEQEAFSVQAMKFNRRSPYRNVSNDYNFCKLALDVILTLKEKGSRISYEQFIILMFNKSGDPKETLKIFENYSFADENHVYEFASKYYGSNLKSKTITRDYPDVVCRLMIICGFIAIRYSGKKFIEINENKLDYIKALLNIDFGLTLEEKEKPQAYFDKLDSKNEEYLKLVYQYRKEDIIDGVEYTDKIHKIISLYKITEDKIVESIRKIDDTKTDIFPEFKEIPTPLKLEFYISILIALKYKNQFSIRPNYKADHIGKPYSHAPGGYGDIDVYSNDIYWLIEVTLIRNKTQQLNNETTSLIRHLDANEKFKNHTTKYLSFVAPVVHNDTKNFLDFSIVQVQKENKKIYIKSYETASFVEITQNKENLIDMEKYTQEIFNKFKDNISAN